MKLLGNVRNWWSFYWLFPWLFFLLYGVLFLLWQHTGKPENPQAISCCVATIGALWCWRSSPTTLSLKKICKLPLLLLIYLSIFSPLFIINGQLVNGLLQAILPLKIWCYGQIIWYFVVISISSLETFSMLDRLNNWFEPPTASPSIPPAAE